MGISLQAAIDAGYEPDPPPGATCQCGHACMRHEPYGGCHECDCPTFWE